MVNILKETLLKMSSLAEDWLRKGFCSAQRGVQGQSISLKLSNKHDGKSE